MTVDLPGREPGSAIAGGRYATQCCSRPATARLRLGRPALRMLAGVGLAVALLAALVPRHLNDPDRAFQRAVAGALAADADDRLLQVALDQYPEQAPAIAITYGRLQLFREQLARFGPQVVPIIAAYQHKFTTADALQTLQSAGPRLWGGEDTQKLAPLTPEERGRLALLAMRDERNAFVGQWEITDGGEARRVPSRLLTLGGPELLVGGLTALERDIVEGKAIDWHTYGLAGVDIAAITSGVALLRFAGRAARGASAARAAAGTAESSVATTAGGAGTAEGSVGAAAGGAGTARMAAGGTSLRSGTLAAAEVLGINVVRFGLPVGLVGLMALHPGVFTHYAWIMAQGLGVPGILGPIVGWSIVILPLSFLMSWLLLSVRVLRLTGSLFAGLARGCQRLAVRVASANYR